MNSKVIRFRRGIFSLTSFVLHHLVVFLTILFLGVLVLLGYKVKNILNQAGLDNLNLLTFMKSPDRVLETTDNRTNFLILGIRGEGADSPDLTDTMLIVSYSHKDNQVTLISVPRDLWVNSLKTKINSVYHYGQFKDNNGGGRQLVQSAILETLGLPIHYTAVINFTLFREAIDLVGGIDVKVANTFTDKQFPIEGKENALPISSRYETITFYAGPNHMDGATALKFVRSRHAEGDEGTDIARDRRQQLVVAALKQKVISPKFLLNRKNLVSLYKLLKDHLDTNINEKIYPALIRLAVNPSGKPIKKIALSYMPDENGVAILENPPASATYLNQWVLVAKDKNWPALQQYLKNKLN